jgi:glycosyltransferase involved in cell wall biosynthesis
MKVLLVNKFNFVKGGADKYFLEVADLLTSRGVKVAKFAMRHPNNLPDKWSKYWPSGINFDRFQINNFFKYLSHIFWNREAAEQFDQLIVDFKPDIVHINNIYHHLSPSILPVAKRRGLPVVMHLHDYKLVCPNYKMFARGRIDESAKGGHYWRCVLRRSVKNSYLKSALAAAEMWLHHKVLKVYEKNVDLYIAPSQFMKHKMVDWGVPADKITVLYHFIDVKKFKPDFSPGNYLLYFGRLDKEKGVDNLLAAMTKVAAPVKLKIIGSGPEYKPLKALTKELALGERVEFLGPKYGETLKKIIARAYLVVIPSRWYEVFGLVNLEAAALGKFVIAAASGGIPEAVQASHTALLYQPESVAELATKLNWSLANPQVVAEGGREAREFVSQHFSPDKHFGGLMKIYESFTAPKP